MKHLKSLHTLMLVFAGVFAFSTTNAQSADGPVKVNGVTIPQSRIDLIVKGVVSQGQSDTPELRGRIREELVTREALAQEAAKKGIDKSPEFLTQMEIQRQATLAQAFVQDYLKENPISEEALRKEYEAAKSQTGAREYKARHILVKDEGEAKQIVAQLKKGANFDKIAAEKSEDTGSKNRGGDLDWSPPNRYVKPFSDALVKLKKGQLTDPPVQSQFGWHVIRLDDERPTKIPPFEEVKGNIQQQLQQQVVQKAIAEVRAKAKVE